MASHSDNPLERVHAARSLLGQAASVDEIERLVDDAQEQIRLYSRESSDARDCEIYAGEIQVRATRQTGKLLKQQDNKGGRPSAENQGSETPGLSKDQRKRARALAAMPEDEFEARIEEIVEDKRAPTVGEILNEDKWAKVPKPEKTKLEKVIDAMHKWEGPFVEADPEEALDVLLFPSADAETMDIVDGRLSRIEHQARAIRAALAGRRRHPLKVVQRGA